MGTPSSVSVIIPAYRAANTIQRAVGSVLDQTRPPQEILVIDDGSPDDLSALLARYGDRVRVIRKENGGAASARNVGIDHATGDLLAFLDADDYWEPEKLARHVAAYEQHPGLGLTCSRYYTREPDGERVPAQVRGAVEHDRPMQVHGRAAFDLATQVSTITVVLPRSLVGGERFPTDFPTAEDRHLWVRLICLAPVLYLPERLATVVCEGSSLSRGQVGADCANMLRLVDCYRELLGPAGVRKWRSHTHYCWAAMEPAAKIALAHLVRSMLLWPLPYEPVEVVKPLARLRLMVVLFLRLIRVRKDKRIGDVAVGQTKTGGI